MTTPLPLVALDRARANNDREMRNRILGQEAQAAASDRAEQERQRDLILGVGQTAAGGDLAGARTQALEGGNFALAGQIDGMVEKMSAQERQKAKEVVARRGLIALEAQQRGIQGGPQYQQLLEQAGLTFEQGDNPLRDINEVRGAVESIKRFEQVQDTQSAQAYRTGEREAAQQFQAGQRAQDRAFRRSERIAGERREDRLAAEAQAQGPDMSKEEQKRLVKLQEQAPKALSSIEALRAQNDLVMQDIGRAIQLLDAQADVNPLNDVTGITGALNAMRPGSPARNARSLLDTIKANTGFDKLNEMRQNSPTGGALGNVTEKEIAFLQAVEGALDPGQDDEQLKENLERLSVRLREREQRLVDAYNRDFAALGLSSVGPLESRPAGGSSSGQVASNNDPLGLFQ